MNWTLVKFYFLLRCKFPQIQLLTALQISSNSVVESTSNKNRSKFSQCQQFFCSVNSITYCKASVASICLCLQDLQMHKQNQTTTNPLRPKKTVSCHYAKIYWILYCQTRFKQRICLCKLSIWDICIWGKSRLVQRCWGWYNLSLENSVGEMF